MTGEEGDDEFEGLIPRICKSLFERSRETQQTHRISLETVGAGPSAGSFTATYIEVYMEGTYDLLAGYRQGGANSGAGAQTPARRDSLPQTLRIREHVRTTISLMSPRSFPH